TAAAAAARIDGGWGRLLDVGLGNKRPEHFVDKLSLAVSGRDVQAIFCRRRHQLTGHHQQRSECLLRSSLVQMHFLDRVAETCLSAPKICSLEPSTGGLPISLSTRTLILRNGDERLVC